MQAFLAGEQRSMLKVLFLKIQRQLSQPPTESEVE